MPSHRLVRTCFAVLAALFFATPLALKAFGVRARQFENRRLTPAPELAAGWNFFDEATRYLIDRMPLRYQAVRANTWIDLNVFHATPLYGEGGLGGVSADQALPFGQAAQDRAGLGSAAPRSPHAPAPPPPTADQVAVGRDGWLYLQVVFDRACAPFVPFAEAAARWEELLRVIRSSGRRVELVVAPDKSTIYPEYVAPGTPHYGCSFPGTAALWRVIESPAAARAGIIGLRRPLLAEKRASSQLLYYRTDSHWNKLGALAYVEAMLPPLGKVRVLSSEIISKRPIRWAGDLDGLLGASEVEVAPVRVIRRAPGAPVVPGPTLLLGDSYSEGAMAEIRPYFASLQRLSWDNSTPGQIARAIAGARTVVLETVEREFDYRASADGMITPALIATIRSALAASSR